MTKRLFTSTQRKAVAFAWIVYCASCSFGKGYAKEIIASHEWQEVGLNDSVPAGLEIRMDLDKGGKWARLPPEEPEGLPVKTDTQSNHKPRCGPSCKERQAKRRVGLRGRVVVEDHQLSLMTEANEHRLLDEGRATNIFGKIFVKALLLIVSLMAGVAASGKLRRAWRNGIHES